MAKEIEHTISKGRIEALTDSLFATVMTILVLGLVVPIIVGPNINAQLSSAIISLIPGMLVYIASFVVLGVIWIGHNGQFRYMHEADNRTQLINVAFLLSVGIVPFSTAFLGKYPLQQAAIWLYAINLFVIAFMFELLARHVRSRHKQRRGDDIRSAPYSGGVAPMVVYLLAIPLSYVSPYISLFMFIIMPAYYILTGLLYPVYK